MNGNEETPAAMTRLYMTMTAFGAATLYHARDKIWNGINSAKKTLNPYMSSSDLAFFLFLLGLWFLLYVACFYENPEEFFQSTREMGFSLLTLPFTTGFVLLDKAQNFLMALPDLTPFSQAQTVNQAQIPLPSQFEGLRDEDLVRKILSDPQFQVQIRRVALEQMEPIRKDILDFSDQKLQALKEEVSDLKSRDTQNVEAKLQEKIAELENEIEAKLAERMKDISDTLQMQSEQKISDLSAKIQMDEGSSQDSHKKMDEIKELESRVEKINQVLLERGKCCKSDAEIKSEGEQLLSRWLQGVLSNSSQRGKDFNAWLEENYVSKKSWNDDLNLLQTSLASSIESEIIAEAKKAAIKSSKEFVDNGTLGATQSNLPSQENVLNLIQDAIKIYDADKTGKFDFALESAGGTIASTRCTETHDVSNAIYSVFGIPFWWERNNPRTILQPGASPGQCWAFKGSYGAVVVKLSEKILPEAITLEHMSKIISPDHTINSAPKAVSVYGLDQVDDEKPVHLGNFTYADNGEPVQTFELQTQKKSFQFVELVVRSNHGNLAYTCLYRLRVHGKLN